MMAPRSEVKGLAKGVLITAAIVFILISLNRAWCSEGPQLVSSWAMDDCASEIQSEVAQVDTIDFVQSGYQVKAIIQTSGVLTGQKVQQLLDECRDIALKYMSGYNFGAIVYSRPVVYSRPDPIDTSPYYDLYDLRFYVYDGDDWIKRGYLRNW